MAAYYSRFNTFPIVIVHPPLILSTIGVVEWEVMSDNHWSPFILMNAWNQKNEIFEVDKGGCLCIHMSIRWMVLRHVSRSC